MAFQPRTFNLNTKKFANIVLKKQNKTISISFDITLKFKLKGPGFKPAVYAPRLFALKFAETCLPHSQKWR